MNPDAVQLHRDSIKFTKRTKALKSPRYSCTDFTSSNSSTSDDSEKNLFDRINSIFEEASSNPRTSEDLGIVEMFKMGIDNLRKRRSIVHVEELKELRLFHGSDNFLMILKENWDKLMSMSGREVDLYAELLSYVRPFVLLQEDQRWALFKQFSLSFMRFERAYEVYRMLGDDLSDTRNVAYNGQIINFYNDLLREVEVSKKKDKCRAILS